jgi:hypothetical protein
MEFLTKIAPWLLLAASGCSQGHSESIETKTSALSDTEGGVRHQRIGDYDGDRKADVAVWRPSFTGGAGTFFVHPSSGGQDGVTLYGQSGDVPTPADYDADGVTDLSVWRPSDPKCGTSGGGAWYVRYSSDPPAFADNCIPFGASGDIPVTGDFDGNGRADYAAWRPSDGSWRFVFWAGGGPVTVVSSSATIGDVPVPADYDGDGKTDIAYWRPSNHTWYIAYSGGAAPTQVAFGNAGDMAVPADYDGDGKADIAVWRPNDFYAGGHGGWYIKYSTGSAPPGYGQMPIAFGDMGDMPVPADYDGDGRTDIAVWRAPDPNATPTNAGGWYFLYAAGGRSSGPFSFGQRLDVAPVNVQADLGCFFQTGGGGSAGAGCDTWCRGAGHSNGGYCPFSDALETYNGACQCL